MNKNRLLVGSIVSALSLLVLLLPFEVPYNVYTTGMVVPLNEWTLSRIQDGNLVSTLKDNRTGKLSDYSVSVFQRGYEARFQLNPKIYRQPYIQKDDTVATMYSNKDEERLVQLQGDLDIQNSELRFYTSGQKFYDVEEIASRTELARQELETQRKMTARTEELYKDSLVSKQTYELAVNQLRIRELDLKRTEASYHSATTGDKPEQTQLVLARIHSLEKQMQQIKNGLKELTIISPVSGAVLLKKEPVNPAEEILLTVADTSAYVVLLPVDYLEKDYVGIGQKVEIAIKGTTRSSFGKIIGIDNTVQIIDGRQSFFVTALFEEKNLPIVPGMLLKTTVWCTPITIANYAKRASNLFFIN